MTSVKYSEKLIIAANQNLKEREYWFGRLAGEVGAVTFCYDFVNTGVEAGALREEFVFDGEVFQGLMRLSNKSDARLHMIFTMLVTVLLHKYTGSDDIILGTPIYKQESDTEFINTVLPLRSRLGEGGTFKDLLLQARQTIVEAAENQNYPIGILAEQLGYTATGEHFPLFDVALLVENVQDRGYIGDLPVKTVFSFKRTETAVEGSIEYSARHYEPDTMRRVVAHLKKLTEALPANINEPIDSFDILSPEEREQLLVAFNGETVDFPMDRSIYSLFEEHVQKNPGAVAVVGREAGNGNPDESGNEAEEISLTYGQLNAKANRLALLLKSKGVESGEVVPVMVDRSPDILVGVLGIMKAGGAYLPLDPGYPGDRLEFMLKDSGAKLLLTEGHLREKAAAMVTAEATASGGEWGKIPLEIIDINEPGLSGDSGENQGNPGYAMEPTDPAYVIYTSGSTGQPKGVMVSHKSFSHAAFCWRREYRLDRMAVNLLQMASFSFDVFAGDIARTLANGGKMVITASGGLDLENLCDLIEGHQVSLLESTPALAVPLMDYAYDNGRAFESLQLVILGSDTCRVADFKRLLSRFGSRMRIINSYGVTEATIDSSYYEGSAEELHDGGNVPIGKPLPNTFYYILDSRQRLLPVGQPGELYIGGHGVALGYLHREGLTKERFIPSPFPVPTPQTTQREPEVYNGSDFPEPQTPSTAVHIGGPGGAAPWPAGRPPGGPPEAHGEFTLYKTGDRARWLADGNVAFLGREDFQVKIRGFRVEPGEIENKLLAHEAVKAVVVDARDDETGDKFLCAYIVPSVPADEDGEKQRLPVEAIKEYLGQQVPDYMVPSYFVELDELPLTANGKVDRKGLPGIDKMGGVLYIAPRHETDEKLVKIWQEVLGVEQEAIGIDNGFFDLGGNSMKAIISISRIHKEFNVKMPLAQMFEMQTIRHLSEYIEEAATDEFAVIEPAEKMEYYTASPAQSRLYLVQQMDPQSVVYNMPASVVFSAELEREKLERISREIIDRHESLRTSFHMVEGIPVQRVHEPEAIVFEVDFYDLASDSELAANPGAVLKRFIRPFDLDSAPLLRVGAATTGDGKFILMVDMHHIITDGLSMNIFIEEAVTLFSGGVLEPLELQYKDYSQWQIQRGGSGDSEMEKQQRFWLEQFESDGKGNVPVMNLAFDFPRPDVQRFEGDQVTLRLGSRDTEALRRLAGEEDVTLYILMLAIFNVLFARICSQEDIVLGVGTAGRWSDELQKIIGMFINILALRNLPAGHKTFREFVKEVKERTLASFDNQDYPFEDLVAQLVPNRDRSRNPLFDVMFSFNNIDVPAVDSAKMEVPTETGDTQVLETGITKFDISIMAEERADSIFIVFEFSTALFKKETIKRYVGYFQELVTAIIEDDNKKLEDYSISHDLLGAKANVSQEDFDDFDF